MGYFCECNKCKRNSSDGKGLILSRRKTYRSHLIKQNSIDVNKDITSEESENTSNSDDILEEEYEESRYSDDSDMIENTRSLKRIDHGIDENKVMAYIDNTKDIIMTGIENNENLLKNLENESIDSYNDTEMLEEMTEIKSSKNAEEIGDNLSNTESESDNYNDDIYENTYENDDNNHEKVNDKNVSIGLKLLETKVKHGLTDAAFNSILSNIGYSTTLYKLQKKLHQLVDLTSIRIDTCKNSCVAFTGDYHLLKECPLCSESRFDSNNKPVNITSFFSLTERLKLQFNNSEKAKEFLYRYNYTNSTSSDNDNYGDIYDGRMDSEII
ncbi:hypothetical protein RhiirA1_402312 [Rhizophagus irregularis]|uniref:Transposase domain-containing protein n=1 Tax=Rhizophagus irregularis TaxID=588596 RepID=A0A2N0QYR6_9GLOM|nr:hypothetical protein RhiirA1_402312 [Rhizophagus irregularis]